MSDLVIPALVDVWPVEGRRVRDQSGAVLPADHVLRGVARSPYWLRLERDGDVTLKPHAPEPVSSAPAPVDLPALATSGGKPKA